MHGLPFLVFSCAFALCWIASSGTPEDPELTFEHLYQFGKNEYTSQNWHDCISFLLRATEDYRYYRDGERLSISVPTDHVYVDSLIVDHVDSETIWCREKCARQISEIPPAINESAESVAAIRLMYAQSQKALCLLR